jgi:hypothetical protein
LCDLFSKSWFHFDTIIRAVNHPTPLSRSHFIISEFCVPMLGSEITLTHHDRMGEEIFEAWIEDESKKRLKEYKTDFLGNKNTVTTYVKSVMDQKFRVCVRIVESERHPILRALCCDLTIDGQCVSSYFLGKWNSHRVDTGITFEDVDGGPGEVIPLRFGQTVINGTTLL